jgi:hypothetical protein
MNALELRYRARCAIAVLLVMTSTATAQTKQQLRSLYDSLSVDTRALDPFKERWVVNDPIIIREVFTQLKRRTSTALAADSLQRLVEQTGRYVSNGLSEDLRLVCTKRYYDQEIEAIEFQLHNKDSSQSLGMLRDYVLVLDALGLETYRLLQAQRYKDRFADTKGTRYDLYLSPLETRIMLWATSPTFEWWRVSAYGRLGNDMLALPFWFKSSVVAALEVSYIDDVTIPGRSYSKFSVAAGIEAVNNFSTPGQESASSGAILKKRKLQGSGDAFFLSVSYTPEKRLNLLGTEPHERLELSAEVSLAIHEKTSYADNIPDTFYTIRNSVVLRSHLRNVGVFQFAAGLAWHDLHRIARYLPNKQGPDRVAPTQSHVLPFIEFGVAEEGSLLQFDIAASLRHDVSTGCGYFGFRSKLMLSNMVGLDLRYFKSYTPSRLPSWQYDTYVLPSFVVRINF